jgi:hypothetical protein
MNVNHLIQKTAILTIALLGAVALSAQALDYVTEEEEDLIRDAQTLEARMAVYLKFLDNRIVALGLRERTAKEREESKKDLADYQSEVKAAAKVKEAEIRAKPVNPDVYLRNTPKSELLRGYMQIIDETMDYIDDSFDRHLDVRPGVESLNKFLHEQLPRFRKLEVQTASETSALKATIAHSERAIEEIEKALQSLPKMEKVPAKTKG